MPRQQKLAFELLEVRNLLAVVVQDDILGIRGTKLSDTIAVERAPNGQYQIDINGQRTFINQPSNGQFRAILIDGWDGDDIIKVNHTGQSGINVPCYIVGGKGGDYIEGGLGANYLFGGAGDDGIVGGPSGSSNVIDGGPGNDYIKLGDGGGTATGGKGNDVMWAGRMGGTLIGGAGNDELHADPTINSYGGTVFATGSTVLDGGAGNDVITGGTGNDDIRGGAGSDTLKGGYSSDKIDGGAGNDAIYGDEDNDWCYVGAGNDIVFGGDGDDFLVGDAGIDQLYGEAGNDTIQGGAGNDILAGDNGDDSLNGDAGNDQIFGDAGKDNIDGGKGNDDCRGGDDDDQLNGGPGIDKLDGDAGNNLYESDNPAEAPVHGLQASLDSEVHAFLSSQQIGGGWADADFKVDYENGAVRSTFTLHAGLPAWDDVLGPINRNTQFTLIIDGKFVGKVTTDSQAMVDVVYSSDPTGNELPFPAAFPTLHAGMTIQIENVVSGTFEYKADL